jgi:hypothetical protein
MTKILIRKPDTVNIINYFRTSTGEVGELVPINQHSVQKDHYKLSYKTYQTKH